jgi:hypothetical protein
LHMPTQQLELYSMTVKQLPLFQASHSYLELSRERNRSVLIAHSQVLESFHCPQMAHLTKSKLGSTARGRTHKLVCVNHSLILELWWGGSVPPQNHIERGYIQGIVRGKCGEEKKWILK